MVSAKDSFHKFEYDLWQNDAGQYKNLLTPGLTTTVANYFLDRQDAILLHDRGRLIGLGRGGGPPFSNEQFKLSDERLVSRNYNLILVGDPLQEGLFSVDDRKAIISAFLWHQDSKVKLTHYFAFIVSVAILKYHIPELARHEGEDSCAFSDASSSIDIARMLARGGLCLECQDAIDRFMSRGALDPTLVDSITALQLSLANEYRVRPDRVSDTPPDTSQQTHEVKATGQVGFEFTGSEPLAELDPTPRWVEQIGVWIERKGLVVGSEISQDLQDVVQYSNPERVTKVVEALNTGRSRAAQDLVDLIAACTRPSAMSLLETIATVGDRGTQILAQEALKTHKVVDDRPPEKAPTPDPRPEEIQATAPIGAKVAPAASEYGTPVDALGYQSYANALGDLITHPKTGTPLTIAICGPWGSGKTTLMDYIKDRIKKVNEESDTEFIPLDFDAWTYSKSDAIWAPFYSAVLKGIEGSLGFWGKNWFRFVMRFNTERAKTTSWMAMGMVSFAITVALTYMVFAAAPSTGDSEATELKQVVTVFEPAEGTDSTAILVIRGPKEESSSFPSLEDWTLEGLAGAATGLFGLIAALIKIFNSVSSGVLGKVKKSGKDLLPLAQEDVVKYVDNVRAWLEPRLDGGKRKRFIVFVDDIDRVEPNKIIQMMEAIQLFLRTKGFVFVLCMDARVVRQAIGQHYSFMGTTYGDREWWGHHYLEKIIQIPFYLPRINLKGMMSLKEKLLGSFVTWPEPVPYQPSDDERPEPEPDTGETETEPTEAAADPAEQRPEQSEIPKASPPLPADPIVDDRMDMTLTAEEDRAFDKLFQDGLELAPRLMVRLKNVYLLARHVYLKSVSESQPPPAFTKWIALSVKYPFEVKELVETSTLIGWPPSWQEVFDTMAADPDSEKWKDLNKDHLEMLAKLLPKHVPSPKDVQQFVAVTNCFNLVLE